MPITVWSSAPIGEDLRRVNEAIKAVLASRARVVLGADAQDYHPDDSIEDSNIGSTWGSIVRTPQHGTTYPQD